VDMKISINNSVMPVLVLGPWANILIRHGYIALMAGAFIFSLFLFLFSTEFNKKYKLDKVGMVLLGIVLVTISASILYHILVIGVERQQDGYVTFVRFYGTLFFLTAYWLVALFFGVDLKKQFYWFASYYFILSLLNIIWGGVVDIFELSRTLEFMQHPNYFDGAGRPYGLTGNAAVNSTMLVITYLVMERAKSEKGESLSWIWFVALFAGVMVQNSGSGMIALLIAAMYKIKNMPIELKLFSLMAIFIVLLVGTLLDLDMLYRISPRYFVHNYLVNAGNVVTFAYMNLSFMDMLFGKAISLGEQLITTDFGPLFILNQMGLVFFLCVTFLLLRTGFRSGFSTDKYIIFIVFVAGIHYQAIYFLSSSIIFSMYIIVVLSGSVSVKRKIQNKMELAR